MVYGYVRVSAKDQNEDRQINRYARGWSFRKKYLYG